MNFSTGCSFPLHLGGKVYSMNKGDHTRMIKHTSSVQSLHCSIYLTWQDVCIYMPRSHFDSFKK